MKKQMAVLLCLGMAAALPFGVSADETEEKEPVHLLVAAAASLEYSFEEEMIPMFQEKYPWITVEGTYDSSGKLQTQIEEGLEADVFLSAAKAQMENLDEEGLILSDSIVELLENEIVVITPKDSPLKIESFEDIVKADTIALGDPASVPAGQYAKEALTNLDVWEEAESKASFGTNVTEVLNWVAEGSADAGIVYATDAATRPDEVVVAASAPEGSLGEPVIYPAAVVGATENPEEAQSFVDFLCSEEALSIFRDYGFTPNQEG